MAILKEDINYSYNLKLYFSFLKKYKFLMFSLLIIILFSEALSLVDKFLFKIVIDKGTLFVANTLPKDQFSQLLIILATIFIIAIITRSILKWIQLHLTTILEINLIVDLKKKFFNHILDLSYHFHTSRKTGSLISRLVRGGRSMESMTDAILFQFTPLIFQLIIVGSSLLYFDKITSIVVILTIISFISYSYFIQQLQRKYTLKANDAEDIEKAQIGDFFTNIDSIKYFGKEKKIKDIFAKIVDNTKLAAMKQWNFYRWLESGQVLILSFGTFFVIYFPLRSFLDGTITIGTITFIYTAYIGLLSPLFSFVYGLREYYRVMADFESLFQYNKITKEIKDKRNAQDLHIKQGIVEFRNISFGYNKKKLFDQFNLKINKNQKVALVGHSGSGKTTLIKLLYRLYDVQEGNILIDNQNIKNVKQESLRSELSIVPQECILFDDTIYNNIAFSNPSASKEQVFQAIKFAQLDKLIQDIPKKENTLVGERGIKLSGGEKQRVSIARAILANKKILVLDEATSSLDSKTEHEIQKDLEQLMRGRTTIIIAHRLSTIMQADKIVVLSKGKIVQIGTHKELIKQSGIYQELWNLQKGGYIA